MRKLARGRRGARHGRRADPGLGRCRSRQWQDPFTALYTHFEQARLSRTYERRAAEFHPHLAPADLGSSKRRVAADARIYARTLKEGDPVGRLRIGRIGLNMVVVQGTDDSTLKRGPGHFIGSGLPGEGRLIYIAGHRTTYLAPFADINDIRIGDYVNFEVPYGDFTYRVTRHYIVPATETLGAPQPRLGDPSPPGVSSTVLRDTPLHRRREAGVGHVADDR